MRHAHSEDSSPDVSPHSSTDGIQPADTPEMVVGVGASAGGLDALGELLANVELGSRACFIVAQHLAPDHVSVMDALLAPLTPLTVVVASDATPLFSDHVIIAPPGFDITVTNTAVQLTIPNEAPGPSPHIDLLFTSIAQHHGDQGVGIVLSGSGSDGARGLSAISSAGGLTIAQEPDTAVFRGMPDTAIALGSVDAVLPADLIGPRLRQVVDEAETPASAIVDHDPVQRVMAVVLATTGIDFTGYRSTTLRRQVHRRMLACHVSSVDDYREVIERDSEEARRLVSCILVPVTQFFRDPDAFVALSAHLGHLVAQSSGKVPLRLWVSGCSTGQEAYSLAMIAAEALGHPRNLASRLQVFATDLSDASLSVARKAEYPIEAADDIPRELRERYTHCSATHVRMSAEVRECVVFARHNVTSDPPLAHIDLVSFRNVMIYLTPSLQRRTLDLISVAQTPHALLFLGSAETIPATVTTYRALDTDHGIFVRTSDRATTMPPGVPLPSWLRPRDSDSGTPSPSRPSDAYTDQHVGVLEALVRNLTGPSMVLNKDRALVSVIGDISAYSQVPEGRSSPDALALLRPELRGDARALLSLATNDGSSTLSQPIAVNDSETVRLRARSLEWGAQQLRVLSFENAEPSSPETVLVDSDLLQHTTRELESAERELAIARTSLARSLEEREAANEEAQATMEELRGLAEELQASYEELERTNEKLQGSNVELEALNHQLKWHSEQLQTLNDDLESVESAANQGMVLVDDELRVTRFTPLAVRVFALLDSDIGLPLLSVPTTMTVPGLEHALAAATRDGTRLSLEAKGHGKTYMVQVMPYLGGASRRSGALITLTDVTEVTNLRTQAESALASLRTTTDELEHRSSHDALTGMINRETVTSLLSHEAARCLRSGESLAVVWLDLDHFKDVNDDLGHEAGNDVLRTVARRIESAIRADDVSARLSGDEFLLVLTAAGTPGELEGVLERVTASVAQPISVNGSTAMVTASMGVALLPDDGTSAEQLMRAADTAMYVAKGEGESRYAYFRSWMSEDAAWRSDLRSALTRATEQGEFTLRYDPIVTFPHGEPWGVTASLDWPNAGDVLGDNTFADIVRETGLSRTLGAAIVQRLLHDYAVGLPEALRVSVSLSTQQLEGKIFIDSLLTHAEAGELAGIMIELSDLGLATNPPQLLDTVATLRAAGLTVAAGNHGSAFANLPLLRDLMPAYAVIDLASLSDSSHPEPAEAFMRASVGLMQGIGIPVVASGVDNEHTASLLATLEIELAQGSWFGAPMTRGELATWVSSRPRH